MNECDLDWNGGDEQIKLYLYVVRHAKLSRGALAWEEVD